MTDTPPKQKRRRWRWLVVLESLIGAESKRLRSLRDATTEQWRSLQHPETRLVAPENQAHGRELQREIGRLNFELLDANNYRRIGRRLLFAAIVITTCAVAWRQLHPE